MAHCAVEAGNVCCQVHICSAATKMSKASGADSSQKGGSLLLLSSGYQQPSSQWANWSLHSILKGKAWRRFPRGIPEAPPPQQPLSITRCCPLCCFRDPCNVQQPTVDCQAVTQFLWQTSLRAWQNAVRFGPDQISKYGDDYRAKSQEEKGEKYSQNRSSYSNRQTAEEGMFPRRQ